MLKIPLADILSRITSETGLSEETIKEQIAAKVAALEGLVSEEGAAFIVASEMGVQLLKAPEKNQDWKIKDLVPGTPAVDVSGNVERVFKPFSYIHKGQAKEMASFILKDDTGEIRAVLWDDKVNLIKENKLGGNVKIRSAQVKVNKLGAKELHLGSRSIIISTGEPVAPVSRVFNRKESKIADVRPDDSVSITATIVKIFPIKAYSVCSKCGKKVVPAPEGFLCPEHKVVMPENRFMLGFYLDDGTGVLKAIAFGKNVEQLAETTKTQITLTPDFTELLELNLQGRVISVDGRIKENKNFARTELLVDSINVNPNPREIAQRLVG